MPKKWGRCDYRQLIKLRDNLAKLQRMDLDKFCRDTSKELAARLLSLVIPATPVGKYSKASGKKGGTLRRGWTARTEQEAAGRGGDSNAQAYAQALPITKQGSTYVVEVINPVHYASYVEFGHRKPGGGWKEGRYFLTISEQQLRGRAPAIIEDKLKKLLRGAFNV